MECQFCGSFACEWDGPVQLGCTECGYDAPEPYVSGVPSRRNSFVTREMRQLTDEAIAGITVATLQACAGVFVLVGSTRV